MMDLSAIASNSFPNSPVVELGPPEVGGVALGDPEGVPAGEGAAGEDRLEFAEHVAKHQAQLRQVTPGGRGVVKHLQSLLHGH